MEPPKNMEDRMVPDSNDTLDLTDWYGWKHLGNSSANWTGEYRNVKRPYAPIQTLQISAVTFYVIMIALGLVSNLLIIIPYFKNASLRRVTANFFIVHMAVIHMVNICIFYPLILKITFGGTGLGTSGNPTACLVLYVAFDMIFIEPGLFSVFCVSVNQCLLIASPQKMYRRCCTHKAIGAVLVVFWCCLFLKAGLQIAYREVDSNKRCAVKGFKNEWMSSVFMFLFIVLRVIPTLAIPVCHVTVLCYIRSSRKRAKGESTRRNNTAQLEVEEESRVCTGITDHTSSINVKSTLRICVVSEMSMVTSVSMAPVNEVDSYHDPNVASCSHQKNSPFEVRVATDNRKNKLKAKEAIDKPNSSGTGPKRNSITEEEPELKEVPKKRSLSRELSRRFSSMKLTNMRMNNRKTSRTSQGPGKAEVRLIKMMIAMYAILVTGWVVSVVSESFIKNWFLGFILFTLGSLIPLFHTLVPYIYLWGNRNYHEAIKTLFGVSRICRSRVRPK